MFDLFGYEWHQPHLEWLLAVIYTAWLWNQDIKDLVFYGIPSYGQIPTAFVNRVEAFNKDDTVIIYHGYN